MVPIKASNSREVQGYRYGLQKEPHWIGGQSVGERYRYVTSPVDINGIEASNSRATGIQYGL
jgi:hypothetical protein